jgi:hypothetical protein
MVDILLQHRIEISELSLEVTLEGETFNPGSSFMISLDQPQHRLIKSLFEPITEFEDSLFYDVSTWTFPYAFNMPYKAINDERVLKEVMGNPLLEVVLPRAAMVSGENSIGYLVSWKDYFAPKALYQILESDLVAQVVTEPIDFQNHLTRGAFGHGTIFIPVEKQEKSASEIRTILEKVSQHAPVEIHPLSTSYTLSGPDMGSDRFIPIEKPEILLLTGEGLSNLEAGEIWHLLDSRMEIPVVLLDVHDLGRIDLNHYTHVIMPSGDYSRIRDQGKKDLKRWMESEGTVIALRSANAWLANQGLVDIKFKKSGQDSTGYRAYAELNLQRGANRISGTIFKAEVDVSHPIGYGLTRRTIPVFRNSTLIPENPFRPYAVPVRYTDAPLLSGYVPNGLYDELRGVPSVIVSSLGKGRIISFFDNPNFRGFWYGTNRLFVNAIFFGPTISSSSTR